MVTLYVVGVVDDEVSIPHYRQVDREVTDVTSFIVVLKHKTHTHKT